MHLTHVLWLSDIDSKATAISSRDGRLQQRIQIAFSIIFPLCYDIEADVWSIHVFGLLQILPSLVNLKLDA